MYRIEQKIKFCYFCGDVQKIILKIKKRKKHHVYDSDLHPLGRLQVCKSNNLRMLAWFQVFLYNTNNLSNQKIGPSQMLPLHVVGQLIYISDLILYQAEGAFNCGTHDGQDGGNKDIHL